MTIGETFETRTIEIRITDTCNFNCSYCSEHDTMKKKYISYLEFNEILKQLEKLYSLDGRKQHLYFWGGEPTLNKDLRKILELTKSKEFITSIKMHSNFSIKNQELLDFLVLNKIECYSSIHPEYFQTKSKHLKHNLDTLHNHNLLLEVNLMFRDLKEFDQLQKIKKENTWPINITPTIQLVSEHKNKVKMLLKITGEYQDKNIQTSNGPSNYIDIYNIDHRGFVCNSPVDNFIINTDGEIFICQNYYLINQSTKLNILSLKDFSIFFEKTICPHKMCVCGHNIFKIKN